MSLLDQTNKSAAAREGYNPATFSEQDTRQTGEPVNPFQSQNGPSTLAAAFANLAGTSGLNTSSLTLAIQPILDSLRKEANLNAITLSASDAPGLYADYIIPYIKVGNSYAIVRLLLAKTITIQLGSAEVPVGPTKVYINRKPSDILDSEEVLAAVINTFAAKLGISDVNTILPFGEMVINDDLASLPPETLKITLEKYIGSRLAELNYIFVEPSNNVLAPKNFIKAGYSRDLKVDSAKGDVNRYTDIQGNYIPAHAVVSVSIERTEGNQYGQDNRNDRLAPFKSNRSDSYTAATAAVVLDLVRTDPVPSGRNDGTYATQFLAPNLVITQTNFGPAQGVTAGLASKMFAIAGALIYARTTNGRHEATWFNLAVAQQQRFEQGGKSPKGIVSNWQVLPAYGYAQKPINFDATKSEGAEMAEVLLDDKAGFIHTSPLISLDLSRSSNTASVDSILLDIFYGDRNAMAQLLAVMDNITDGRFSQYLGNSPIFVPNYCTIVPDGTAVFNGETCSLREITTQSLATRSQPANQSMEDWFAYQSSTIQNNETNYAAVYAPVFNNGQTNVNITGTYSRLQLTNECISALERSFFEPRKVGDVEVGLRLLDTAKLKSYGAVGFNHGSGRNYTGGVGSSSVSYGSHSGHTSGYFSGGSRFTRR